MGKCDLCILEKVGKCVKKEKKKEQKKSLPWVVSFNYNITRDEKYGHSTIIISKQHTKFVKLVFL